MKEIKKIEKVEQKPAYEPVEMQVNVITPMGVLCASGGGFKGMLGPMSRTNGSW